MTDTFRLTQPYGFGRGSQFVVLGVAPAAAANFSLKIDSTYVWRLVAAEFTFTADANAANRALTVQRQDSGGNVLETTGAASVVTANTAAVVHGSARLTTAYSVTNGDWFMPLPAGYFFGGNLLVIAASNKQAADAFTAIRLTFDRFQTNAEHIAGETE